MTGHPIHDLDDDVHQRVRLGILASLSGIARADFTHLKRELSLTDGNLGRHLEVLENARLVKVTREQDGRRSRMWIKITPSGRRALHRELEALKKIIDQIGRNTPIVESSNSTPEAAPKSDTRR
jgi:DNA-binding MarR family transcriptional regulator